MANLSEFSVYEPGVYQLERADVVDAGVGGDGIANQQAKQLANRTKWLKGQVDALNALKGTGVPVFSSANSYTAGQEDLHL